MSNARNLSKLIPSSTGLIQTANITDDAITNAKIGAGAVTNTEVNASAAIASSKLGTIGTDKMPSGSIIQTLSMTLTGASSAQGNSYTDTGLTLDITPISTSSKVLVTGFVNVAENYFRSYIIVVRDSTTLAVGDSASNRPQVYSATAATNGWDTYDISPIPINILDSPNTTSQVTYKIQYKDYQGTSNSASAIAYINRSHSDRDNAFYDPRTVSVLTVQEIAG
tara:strand:+ start:1624 stop:2295 length:672 start_codon:yes stop_codon:yes gene_type:complete